MDLIEKTPKDDVIMILTLESDQLRSMRRERRQLRPTSPTLSALHPKRLTFPSNIQNVYQTWTGIDKK